MKVRAIAWAIAVIAFLLAASLVLLFLTGRLESVPYWLWMIAEDIYKQFAWMMHST